MTDAIRATQLSVANSQLEAHSGQLVELPNQSVLAAMQEAVGETAKQVRAALEAATAVLASALEEGSAFVAGEGEWKLRYETFLAAYAEAKSRSSAQQAKLEQLDQLERRARSVRERLNIKKRELQAAGTPEAGILRVRSEWCDLHEQRSEILEAQCRLLTLQSDGQIRATLVRGGASEAIVERLRNLLSGTGITRVKLEKLVEGIQASSHPVRALEEVLGELERLSLYGAEEAQRALPATPLLSAAGLTDKELTKTATRVTADAWLELCVVSLDDQPEFAYRLREADYIPFANASAGQQATALLWALLNQGGPPLLIDQPEDDLDNQIVLRLVEQIWKAKETRQLLFASHSANVVVNGDADLVICCDYRVPGEQAGGWIKLQGAIDVPDVRDEIAAVMEGGKAAFRLRQEKYGF
jgi:type III restriction enzyme